MIEKFTEEEIKQIRMEIAELDARAGDNRLKKNLIFRKRILSLFPEKHYPAGCGRKQNGMSEGISNMHIAKSIETSIFMICDYTFGNYVLTTDRFGQNEYQRSSEIMTDVDNYRQMGNDIIEVIKKWRKNTQC